MNIALLIIDVQEAFIGHRRSEQQFSDTFEYIHATADLFRSAEKPVIIIRDTSEGDGENYKNVKELQTCDTDIEILKMKNNAFWETTLESTLKAHEVDFLVLCGSAAEFCVLATYNGAIERGFGAAMLQNGIFANHDEGLLDLFKNRALISYQVVSYMLK